MFWATSRGRNMCASFLNGLQGEPGPRFPILLKKVVYDGTHTGDWIPIKQIAGTAEGS